MFQERLWMIFDGAFILVLMWRLRWDGDVGSYLRKVSGDKSEYLSMIAKSGNEGKNAEKLYKKRSSLKRFSDKAEN